MTEKVGGLLSRSLPPVHSHPMFAEDTPDDCHLMFVEDSPGSVIPRSPRDLVFSAGN